MQTFLPYPNLRDSAACLDDKRLGKQRVEAMQILSTLRGLSDGWRNHPAVRMWEGFESCLELYLLFCVLEWEGRGYVNNIRVDYSMRAPFLCDVPDWLGDFRIHSSHRAALLAKEPEWYDCMGWTEEPEINYWWPR